MEFLISLEVNLPPTMTASEREDLIARERVRGRELCEAGVIRALWRVPGRFANRAIWSTADATELHQALTSLPTWPFDDIVVTPLATHESARHCRGIPQGLAVADE